MTNKNLSRLKWMAGEREDMPNYEQTMALAGICPQNDDEVGLMA